MNESFIGFNITFQAVTGKAVLSRCQKARTSFEQSLIQIQGMVPVMLAAEVSQTIFPLQFPFFKTLPNQVFLIDQLAYWCYLSSYHFFIWSMKLSNKIVLCHKK